MNRKIYYLIIAITAMCITLFATCKKDNTPVDPKLEMIFVEGGTFTMGCTDDECREDEEPAHQVTLSSYYIGKYPVTQAQWKAVIGSNPSHHNGCNDCPVEEVSWEDAQEFINKLNELTGKNYRLPTEAEWEYAARGGNKSQGYKYSGSNDINEVAWYYENSEGTPHPIGTKVPNELDIYDMSGNVFEWCNDWYATYTEDAQVNPQGSTEGLERVCRGGAFEEQWFWDHYFAPYPYRVSGRASCYPSYRGHGFGFRVALSFTNYE